MEDNYNYSESDKNYISYDEIKLHHELEMAKSRRGYSSVIRENHVDDADVILIDSDDEDDDDYDDEDDPNGSKPDKPYECDLCFRKVATSYNLKRHMMIHTGEKPYGCDMCEKRFREFSDLKKHRRVHSHDIDFKCMVCYRNAPSPYNPTKCEACEHKEVGIKNPIPIHPVEVPRMDGNKKAYVCAVCDRIFGSSHNLKRHVMIHTGEKPYKCPICNRSFREMSTMRKHQVTHTQSLYSHGNGYRQYRKPQNLQDFPDNIDALHTCVTCGKHFQNIANLAEHLQVAHIQTNDSDTKTVSNNFTKSSSNNSMNIVDGFYSLHCKPCNRRFLSKQHLRSHLLTHDD